MKKLSFVVAALAAVSLCFADGEVKDKKSLKVLMIGNSFSICNLAEMPNVAASMGLKLDLASLYIGGGSLESHRNNICVASTNAAFRPYRFDRTTDGKKVVENGEANIQESLVLDKWDVVTIQQASHYSWRPETFEPFGGSLVEKIRELAPQAKIVVQETWSYPPWDKRLKKFGFDQAEMYKRLHAAYASFARKYGFEVIPVGTAAEFVPNRNSLFTEPDFHFDKEGKYLQGLAFTAKLFGVDVRKCPYKPCWMDAVRAEEIKAAVMDAEIDKARVPAKAYDANWESLNTRPCPQWWKDAKFGIFIHWGLYSVPAFAPGSDDGYAEHYANPRRWKDGSETVKYHAKYYPNKSYNDFAADFKAENFDPSAWADLFRRAGAKYVVLTSKHHDGFALWPSAQSPYFNAADVGPKRDLCGDLTEAVRAAGLHMGFYYSLLEWRHPLYNKDDIGKFVERVDLPQLRDLVVRYRPEIVWTDGEWDYPWQVWRGPEFLAWLYNESPVKDTVVANDRWGKGFRGKCGDHYTTEYEDIAHDAAGDSHPWEECRGIGLSFGYNRFETTEHYLSNEACIETLCDKVSRGGNLLLNIGPTADGLIPVIMEERLLAIGKWLEVNGEAIYGTTAWEKRPKDMKKSRVYFTKKGGDLYAIVFGSEEKIAVPDVGEVKAVSLLGSDREISWRRVGGAVEIDMPLFRQGTAPCEHALVFKIEE